MSTIVRQSTDVVVNITEKTITYIVNTMFQMFLRISCERKLGPAYITRNREIIENGLFVWLGEQTLQWAYLEVFLEGENEAIERWDFQFTYAHTIEKVVRQPPVNEIGQLCAKLKTLPARARYRVVVYTAPGASKVPGWEPTELRTLNESASESVQGWSYGNIEVGLTYKGGRPNSQTYRKKG